MEASKGRIAQCVTRVPEVEEAVFIRVWKPDAMLNQDGGPVNLNWTLAHRHKWIRDWVRQEPWVGCALKLTKALSV